MVDFFLWRAYTHNYNIGMTFPTTDPQRGGSMSDTGKHLPEDARQVGGEICPFCQTEGIARFGICVTQEEIDRSADEHGLPRNVRLWDEHLHTFGYITRSDSVFGHCGHHWSVEWYENGSIGMTRYLINGEPWGRPA
jgi:hypothetical protein